MHTVGPVSALPLLGGLIVSANVELVEAPLASFSVIVKPKDCSALGVPLIRPPVDMLNPVGSEPEVRLHASGSVPPLAVI